MSTGAAFLAQQIHGRAPAMARLDVLLEMGGTLALVGEAGIGKSRLARHASERAAERRMVVLEGAATLGLAEPLGIVCDLVRGARRAGLEPPAGDRLASSFVARILPELGGDPAGAGNLGATFEGASRYLRGLAGRHGALVVLEDLHWADATSLSLVPFLARTLKGAPVALLLTHRPADESAGSGLEPMRAELARGRLADELVLAPLDPGSAQEMLAELLGSTPAAEVRDELLRLSAGNPFALEELTRAAADSGWLDPDSGARVGAGPVALPWTLAESIRARAARLDPAERELLGWAALIGERLDLRLVAAAAEISEDDALVRVDGLVAAGLVVEAPGVSTGDVLAFRHALVREALLQEGLAGARRRRHARILAAAEELAHQGALELPAAELARHAVAGGDRERAMAYSRAAVAEAEQLGAIEEAVEHMERALDLWDSGDGPALRAELLLATGALRARVSMGDRRAIEHLEAALALYRELGVEGGAAQSLATLAGARYAHGDSAGAFEDWAVAMPALRAHGPPDALRRSLVAWTRALAVEYRQTAALAAADEGLRLVPQPSTAAEAFDRAALLTTKGMVALWRCDAATGRTALEEAARLASDHHDDVSAASALYILAVANVLLVPVAESSDLLRRAVELLARHGLRSRQAHYASYMAWLAASAGEWQSAQRLIEETGRLLAGDDGASSQRFMLEDAQATVHVGRGDLALAEQAYLAALSSPFANSARSREILVESLASIRLVGGDGRGAAELMEPVIEDHLALIAKGDAEVERIEPKVAVLAATGDHDRGARIVSWAEGLLPGNPWIRCCRTLLDLHADPLGAAGRLETAATEWEALGWRVDGARVRVTAAVIAERAGGRAAAVTLARSANARFRELGAESWCRRLEAMLRSWGERAPTRAGPGEGGLSARELEVLVLVAEGLTNRQIAERLVVSPHTAVRHVSNLMAKLGAPSRAAAVRIAGERGLLADGDGRMASPAGTE